MPPAGNCRSRKKHPTRIMMMFPQVALAKPVYERNSLKLETINSVKLIVYPPYPIVMRGAPSITVSPLLTRTEVTVPEFSASILFCIFIASSTTTVSPIATASPTLTHTSVTVPGI